MGGQVEPANSGNAQPAHEGNGSDNRKKGRQGASTERLCVQYECLRVFVRKRWAVSNASSRTVFSLGLSASVPCLSLTWAMSDAVSMELDALRQSALKAENTASSAVLAKNAYVRTQHPDSAMRLSPTLACDHTRL